MTIYLSYIKLQAFEKYATDSACEYSWYTEHQLLANLKLLYSASKVGECESRGFFRLHKLNSASFSSMYKGSFQKDQCTNVRWIRYAAEEIGLLGSQDIATNYSAINFPIHAMLQVDMCGGVPGMLFLVSLTSVSCWLCGALCILGRFIKLDCRYICFWNSRYRETNIAHSGGIDSNKNIALYRLYSATMKCGRRRHTKCSASNVFWKKPPSRVDHSLSCTRSRFHLWSMQKILPLTGLREGGQRWCGHTTRMSAERLARKMLMAWYGEARQNRNTDLGILSSQYPKYFDIDFVAKFCFVEMRSWFLKLL